MNYQKPFPIEQTTKRNDREVSNVVTLEFLEKNILSPIAGILPIGMPQDRWIMQMKAYFFKNRNLLECTPESLVNVLSKVAATGLSLTTDRCYIIPFKDWKTKTTQATFIPGWRGLIDLATRHKKVLAIEVEAVFNGDEFEYELGSKSFVKHKKDESRIPNLENPIEGMRGIYTIIKMREDVEKVSYMTFGELEAHRLQFCNKKKSDGTSVASFWDKQGNKIAMYKKTALLQTLKYAPMSVDLEDVMTNEEKETDEEENESEENEVIDVVDNTKEDIINLARREYSRIGEAMNRSVLEKQFKAFGYREEKEPEGNLLSILNEDKEIYEKLVNHYKRRIEEFFIKEITIVISENHTEDINK